MDSPCISQGSSMDTLDNPWTNHGYIPGFFMPYQWITNNPWIIHGQDIDHPWIIREGRIGFPTYHGIESSPPIMVRGVPWRPSHGPWFPSVRLGCLDVFVCFQPVLLSLLMVILFHVGITSANGLQWLQSLLRAAS